MLASRQKAAKGLSILHLLHGRDIFSVRLENSLGECFFITPDMRNGGSVEMSGLDFTPDSSKYQ